MDDKPFLALDAHQERAAALRNQPGGLAIASMPGSGKTRTAIEIARRWIEEDGVDPRRIVLVTYTRAAAAEMRNRLGQCLEPDRIPQATTFHRFGYRLILSRPKLYFQHLDGGLSIWDEQDRTRWMRRNAAEILGVSGDRKSAAVVDRFLGVLESCLNQGDWIADRHIKQAIEADGVADWDQMVEFLMRFSEHKMHRNLLDFHDLIILPRVIADRHPDYCSYLQNRYTHWLVDEFQDINPAQFRLLTRLADPDRVRFGHCRVVAIGDPRQTIYLWRDAMPDAFDRFIEVYGATRTELPVNYRCPPGIVAKANRIYPGMKAASDAAGRAVRLYRSKTDVNMAELVAKQAAHLIQTGVPPEDIVILSRINRILNTVQAELFARGVPSRLLRGTDLAERKEVRMMAAMARLVVNAYDEDAFVRVFSTIEGIGESTLNQIIENEPEGGVSGWMARIASMLQRRAASLDDAVKSLERIPEDPAQMKAWLQRTRGLGKGFADSVDENGDVAAVTAKARQHLEEKRDRQQAMLDAVRDLAERMAAWRTKSPATALEEWRDHPLFRFWFDHAVAQEAKRKDEVQAKNWAVDARRNIRSLIQAVRELRQEQEEWARLTGADPVESWWQSAMEVVAMDPQKTREAGAVLLSTVHGFKGMEAGYCFIVGADQGIMPAENADPREERNIFFVALTRATKSVFIHGADVYLRLPAKQGPTAPSVFLADIFPKAELSRKPSERRRQPPESAVSIEL